MPDKAKQRELLELWKKLHLALDAGLNDRDFIESGSAQITLKLKDAELLKDTTLRILSSGAFGIVSPSGKFGVSGMKSTPSELIVSGINHEQLQKWIDHWNKNKASSKITETLLSAVTGKKKVKNLESELTDYRSLILVAFHEHQKQYWRPFFERWKLGKRQFSKLYERGVRLIHSSKLEPLKNLSEESKKIFKDPTKALKSTNRLFEHLRTYLEPQIKEQDEKRIQSILDDKRKKSGRPLKKKNPRKQRNKILNSK
ncbi:hypothetical protein FAI40_08555 [Acetobacteraceae bacterium]|nr:hypothetical protein FAI40_08555 [Acetobacteraceae bacterium]